jgi:hypothetical protein
MDYSRLHAKTPENRIPISMKSLDSCIGSEINIFIIIIYKEPLGKRIYRYPASTCPK